MKRNDFLQNLLLIILSAVLAACIVNLACLGALPVTYTSRVQVQITGDDLHVRDVREFAGYIEGDEALRNKVRMYWLMMVLREAPTLRIMSQQLPIRIQESLTFM